MRPLTDGDRDVLAEANRDAAAAERQFAAEYEAAFPTVELTEAELDAMYAEWRDRHPDADDDDEAPVFDPDDEFPF